MVLSLILLAAAVALAVLVWLGALDVLEGDDPP
jgi:hypothetical protein